MGVLLNYKQKKIAIIIGALILCLSAFELLIFSLIQPIILFFTLSDGAEKIKYIGNNFITDISAIQVLIFFLSWAVSKDKNSAAFYLSYENSHHRGGRLYWI